MTDVIKTKNIGTIDNILLGISYYPVRKFGLEKLRAAERRLLLNGRLSEEVVSYFYYILLNIMEINK